MRRTAEKESRGDRLLVETRTYFFLTYECVLLYPMIRTTRFFKCTCRNLCAGCGFYWSRRVFSAARRFWEKRHQNKGRSRATAPADLELPRGLGSGLRLGLWSGGSGPTCKVEIDGTSTARSCVQAAPVHGGSPRRLHLYMCSCILHKT